jgi:hypothetical protein
MKNKNFGFCRGGEELEKDTLHGGEELEKDTLHGGEILVAGTLGASYSPGVYRTVDGLHNFIFQYIDLGNYFEIDILEMPPLNGRNNSAHIIHVQPSERSGKMICVNTGKEPKDIEAAKNLSVAWARVLYEYILTGVTIDEQIAQKTNGSRSWLSKLFFK